MKKFIKELDKIRGRHTELVSVYVPSGFNIQDTIGMLKQEYTLASNVKDKTVRKNVMSALEKVVQHLRIFKQTPPNGVIVFCGNVSDKPGAPDIKLWSIEPPEKLAAKIYRCDQIFILDPLKEMVKEREVYALIVVDAKEATIGLLKGKAIQSLKHIESTVPSKTVKGGMCVSEDTLIQLEDGNIIPIKNLFPGNKILSYSFTNLKQVFNDSFEIFKRKSEKSYELIFKEPSNSLVITPEHMVFVVSKDGIVEKSVGEVKTGDMLLSICDLQVKNKDNEKIDYGFSQFLGYMLGDGTIDNNRIILYDKNIQILNFYKRIAESIINKKAIILKRRNSYELRLYKKSFVEFIRLNFPELSKHRRAKNIDAVILTLPKDKIRYFIRGVFDAEGYVDKTGIGLRMTNESIVRKLQLILTRFNVVASLRGPDKFDRYELRITNPFYIKKFEKEIRFSALKKIEKLNFIIKKYRSGKSTRAPISGILIRKLIEKEGFKKEDFKKYSMFLVGKRNVSHPVFKRMINEFGKKFKNKQTLNMLEKISNSGLITITVKEKKEIKLDRHFYDLYVPKSNSFVANGIVVHNSQGRYDRLREDAVHDFLKEVGEKASEIFLKEENLIGLIIGGPGPIKDRFAREEYLNYQIKKKLLGVKDISYTDEYGLEELAKRSTDLMEKAAVVKERGLVEKFFAELQKGGNVVYGFDETNKILEQGAIETLLLSEGFDWVHAKLKCQCGFKTEKDLPKDKTERQLCNNCQKPLEVEETKELMDVLVEKAKSLGTNVEFISIDTREGAQFKELGGIGGFLRYKLS